MEHLLEPQIRESCRLALPEGLKDLMSDISREVLRAQPEDLYQFIADYLSVLLVAREHIFIASRVCDDVCKKRCRRDLEEELRKLSLSEEDVKKSLEIIMKFFSTDQVKEGNLLQRLIQETDIGMNEVPEVQEAIRRAFLRHRLKETSIVTLPSDDDDVDEIALAAKHTLNIYEKATEQPDINYDCVATKIQEQDEEIIEVSQVVSTASLASPLSPRDEDFSMEIFNSQINRPTYSIESLKMVECETTTRRE